MLFKQFLRNTQMRTTVRWFTRNDILRDNSKIDKIPQKSNKNESVSGINMYQVTNLDKRILVWVKRYPSIADVPETVTIDCVLVARSKARVKACNYMVAASVIGFIIAAILGKKQAAKGDNLFKQRQDWFKEINAEKDK